MENILFHQPVRLIQIEKPACVLMKGRKNKKLKWQVPGKNVMQGLSKVKDIWTKFQFILTGKQKLIQIPHKHGISPYFFSALFINISCREILHIPSSADI